MACLTVGSAFSQEPSKDYYRKWLREDVLYIITPEEAEVFKNLRADEERDNFIEQFWLRRDSDPHTAANEYKAEHYRRIAYANEQFASGIPGWKTDRGMIYIKFGPPDRLERNPTGGDYRRPSWEGGGSTTTYPFEVWEYRHLEGVSQDVEIEFVDDTLSGEYRMASNPDEKDALLHVPNAGLTDAEMLGLVAQKIDRIVRTTNPMPNHNPLAAGYGRAKDQPFEKLLLMTNLHKAPAIGFSDLKAQVQAHTYFDQIPFQLRSDVFEHGSQGRVLVTLYVDSSQLKREESGSGWRSELQVYALLKDLSGRIVRDMEDSLSSITPKSQSGSAGGQLVYQKDFFLEPGRYKLEFFVKDQLGGRIGSSQSLVVVPRPEERLRLSSVMLARRIESVPRSGGSSFKIWPAEGQDLPQANLKVGFYYEIYGFQTDQSSGRPDLEIRYEILDAQGKVLSPLPDFHTADPAPGRITVMSILKASDLEVGRYI
ncbi:MAG: GWxTD domain-containing protein, partial [Acidobacteriota bacterium]